MITMWRVRQLFSSWFWRALYLRKRDQALLWFVIKGPYDIVNSITSMNIGRLITNDPRLHNRVVPEITIDEIIGAMQYMDEQALHKHDAIVININGTKVEDQDAEGYSRSGEAPTEWGKNTTE